MIFKKISLVNFRNYSGQDIQFCSNLNFISGNNGEGKTNILEAISLITFGKSFLNSPEQDCIKFDENEFSVVGTIESSFENSFNVAVTYNNFLKKKSFLLNGEKVSSFSAELFGRFPVVFLTPQSLNITYGNPSERRRFFDIIISQVNGVYLNHLKDLNKIVKQKNALLKDSFNSRYSTNFKTLLETYNEKLVEVSVELYLKRFAFLDEFYSYLLSNFNFLIKEKDVPEIKYLSSFIGEYSRDAFVEFDKSGLSRMLSDKLNNISSEEVIRGICLAGPHRDDYVFRQLKPRESDKAFSLKNFASQGEHKTFLIALKLAEFEYIKDKTSIIPILLLDDILSELDSTRVFKIISHLKDYGQIFLTSTEKEYMNSLKEICGDKQINFYTISNNKVIEEVL